MSSGNHLVKALLKHVPELTSDLQREAAFWGYESVEDLGTDAAFGSVLAPKVVELLCNSSWRQDPVLIKAFGLLEELAASDDDAALSAVDVSFAETLLSNQTAYERARHFFGPNLDEAFRFILRRRGALPWG